MTRYMITTLVSLALVICLSFLLLFSKSQAKYNQAEKEAVDLVSYDYDVKQVKNFYWSTTDATYFSLDFIDQDLQERYAIIPQEGERCGILTEKNLSPWNKPKKLLPTIINRSSS